MATYKIFDRADQYRIEIVGRLAAAVVQEVRQRWEDALREAVPRRLSIDISRLSGYDSGGRNLLVQMYHHGTQFAARTPSSLVFLKEIANAVRRPAPVIAAPFPKPSKSPVEPRFRAIAASR